MTTGILFDDRTVELDDRALALGGAWWDTGRAYHDNMLRQFYQRWSQHPESFTLMDVGASTGAYALLAAHLPQMTVHAFEPYTHAYEVLQANIHLNHLQDRIWAYPIAMFDELSLVDFRIAQPEGIAGLSQLGGAPASGRDYRVERHIALTVDFFVQHWPIAAPDVLKIDVEGGELMVLHGAEQVLRRHHPVVIAEYSAENSSRFGYHPDEMQAFLASLGYNHFQKEHEDIIAEVV